METWKGKGMILVGALTCMTGGARAQLVLNNALTPQYLVENVLLGGGVTVSNVTFNGAPGTLANIQIGSFDGSATNVQMNNGIMLASGDINIAQGPNNSGGFTLPAAGVGGPGDPDLTQALGGTFTTNDAAVLEFDFVPAGDSLKFNYVFGSEEYLEWVNSSFNDVFGFFLSGPGISGPYSGGAINIALVPGTTMPVTIDNVNNVVNSTYYNINGDGSNAPYNSSAFYIQFDGFTKVLTAKALVQCGQTYHIKIAVADAGDMVLDSGVFIEAGSFSSPNAIQLEVVTASADGTITEGCSEATVTISRPGNDQDIDVTVEVGGTAVNGVDFTAIPPIITIPDGENSVSFTIAAYEDGVTEGPETITLTATFVNACGDTSISTVAITILDHTPLELFTEDQILQCQYDSVQLVATYGGGYGALTATWITGEVGPSIWVPARIYGSFSVTVTDECGWSISDNVLVEPGCEIIIPNVFTPNGDGLNDVFYIEGILGTRNTVKIFNRWGMPVYEATNYRNNWRGGDVTDGTYFYEVLVEGDPKRYTGHLTILNGR
ncbi:MAG: choice-of-anchor L domain-containing protein [Flavobacteriales bacterium]|nr:choice-of-anchor L domain-containing protein [Flavobacteriales bacterium]